LFKAHQLPAPESSVDVEELGQLEGKLPEGFANLSKNSAFVALLRRVDLSTSSDALRRQLVRRPLTKTSIQAFEAALGVTESERMHLKNLREGTTSQYLRNEILQQELRRLRAIGLISMKRSIYEIPLEFDLGEWAELTVRGYEYLRLFDESSSAD
jgi:hypothetical protein